MDRLWKAATVSYCPKKNNKKKNNNNGQVVESSDGELLPNNLLQLHPVAYGKKVQCHSVKRDLV